MSTTKTKVEKIKTDNLVVELKENLCLSCLADCTGSEYPSQHFPRYKCKFYEKTKVPD